MTRVDTIEGFLQMRDTLAAETIHSRSDGDVAVPCMAVLLVRRHLLEANDYNPNEVPGDKLELLRRSIVDNGFCFPIVTIFDADRAKFVIVDGFHRALLGGEQWLDFDYLPIVVLDHGMTRRMAATVQFNKARGVHQVDLDAEIVRKLLEQGLSEDEVATRLGLESEAVHRYKQLTGVATLFRNADYSMAWEMAEDGT
jgi:ParB-like chromosome segregation protein Spo0J